MYFKILKCVTAKDESGKTVVSKAEVAEKRTKAAAQNKADNLNEKEFQAKAENLNQIISYIVVETDIG